MSVTLSEGFEVVEYSTADTEAAQRALAALADEVRTYTGKPVTVH
jgi:hypothetical protein